MSEPVSNAASDAEYFRARAQAEIALAKATGAKAHASADHRTVFIERRDGAKESVRLRRPKAAH